MMHKTESLNMQNTVFGVVFVEHDTSVLNISLLVCSHDGDKFGHLSDRGCKIQVQGCGTCQAETRK